MVAAHQALFGTFLQGNATYNPVLWTMRIEFLGSFLVFAAASLFGSHGRRWIIYAILVLVFLKTYFLGFVVGMILADLRSRWPDMKLPGWLAAPALVGGLGLGSLHGGPSLGIGGTSTCRPGGHAHYSATNAHLLAYHRGTLGGRIDSVLGCRTETTLVEALVFVDKLSFPIYLVHFIVLFTLSSYLFVQFAAIGYVPDFVMTFLISAVVIAAASYVFSKWADGPAIRLSHRFGDWIEGSNHNDAHPAESAPTRPPAQRDAGRMASQHSDDGVKV